MCGICFILGFSEDVRSEKDDALNSLLSCRGPDITYSKNIKINDQLTGIFKGCVLWLQGEAPQKQPLSDEDGNIFLWNGDDFNFERDRQVSDSLSIFHKIKNKGEEDIISYLSSIEGPWSFIYYSSLQQKIYFGRDIFGRRSLLWTPPECSEDNFILCSVGRRQDNFQEVPALGIYSANVTSLLSKWDQILYLYPFNHITSEQLLVDDLKHIKILNCKLSHNIRIPLLKEVPTEDMVNELRNCSNSLQGEQLIVLKNLLKEQINKFNDVFKKAIEKRINACPPKCKRCTSSNEICNHPKFGVLFSGGLDSTLIALFLSKCLPLNEPIDLLNVSFGNRPSTLDTKKQNKKGSKVLSKSEINFNSPDRVSGLASLRELQSIDQSRIWNFVEINVTAEELEKERNDIINHLIAPHSSVLDDSIGCALYFCGRGVGFLNEKIYTSTSRVIFSGLGADEQLGGYSRHRGKFCESGWEGLVEEIDLEMGRIHARNCGRDDRVLSHHGRTVRFPYLDEDVVNCLNSFPIWTKANLYMPRGFGEKILLRVIAALHSLPTSASLPKKAIQFGSRIAKLENNKEKGKDICRRLQKLPL